MKKDARGKEPIRLRQRVTPSGRVSLYLDIYEKGRRKYEYLNLYLLPGNGRDVKVQNANTLSLARDILAKRLVEYRNGKYGFINDKGDVPLILYIESLLHSGIDSATVVNYRNMLYHIRRYSSSPDMTFAEITPQWIRGFKAYLDSLRSRRGGPLTEGTKKCYLASLKACIRRAIKEGIIAEDPALGVDGYKSEDSKRMYLTIDELGRLSETPCGDNTIRRAFLFSCLTGLRLSDVRALTWDDVQTQGDFTRIIFRQQKTGHQEYLDMNAQAVELMGERSAATERVFHGLRSSNCINSTLRKWISAAGINKKITFHCARHTFATMMLEIGTDIYVVSKLLGHTNLSTTQIYTKVVDKNKQAAVAAIPKILK